MPPEKAGQTMRAFRINARICITPPRGISGIPITPHHTRLSTTQPRMRPHQKTEKPLRKSRTIY